MTGLYMHDIQVTISVKKVLMGKFVNARSLPIDLKATKIF